MNTLHHFHANGKLLLSGEYFVLDGALALAVPTSKGQAMKIEKNVDHPSSSFGKIHWISYLENEEHPWFQASFNIHDFQCLESSNPEVATRLVELFRSINTQKPAFWPGYLDSDITISSHLEFPREWGLGSSSTLISLLAQWSDTNPYTLLGDSFGGSGYDLACATAEGPIFYQKIDGQPIVETASFRPPFVDYLYFVFLGKKQNSREGIKRYRQKVGEEKTKVIEQISKLTIQMAAAQSLEQWNQLIEEHEDLISKSLKLPKVKTAFFPDFPGSVKSLGAWGGDFVMVSSELGEENLRAYFGNRGLEVVIPFGEMLKDKYNDK